MDKELENMLKEVEDEYKWANEENEELLNKLYLRKKRVESKIKEHRVALNDLLLLLNQTNIIICEIRGHSFNDWEERPYDILDGYGCYERKCSVCGKTEITEKILDVRSEDGKKLVYKKD